MISAQVLMNCIEELRMITRVNLAIFDLDGAEIVSTFESSDISPDMLKGFAQSPADSQVIGMDHLLKITDEGELVYILVARGSNDETYLIARIAASQIQQLITAYKERFDRNNFFQNLLLDNFLLVDVYNRAKKLHLEVTLPRVVYIVETQPGKDSTAAELLKGMFSSQSGDFVTAVDESRVILIKALERGEGEAEIEQTAQTIVDMMSTEAMLNVRVAYGSAVQELKDVSKSYKGAKMEIVSTVNKFFENNLNVSETSRQLFVHRNTLVYRIEKLEKSTGLDVRTFDDALTFKIAMMVYNYMKYLEQ